MLFVTHDRRFLDRVATRIIELDRGRLLSYPGNFAAYEARKAEQLAVEAVANRKFDKLLAQEEVWIRKGVEARRTRNEGRVRRLERCALERAARRDRLGKVELAVGAGERSGKLVAELEHVTKRYGDQRVVEDFSDRIMRGDKIGLIGPNGTRQDHAAQADPGRARARQRAPCASAPRSRWRTSTSSARRSTRRRRSPTPSRPGSDFVEIDGGAQARDQLPRRFPVSRRSARARR